MKTLVIGDIHGCTKWKDHIEKTNPDKVIFIGDYFDSFNHSLVEQVHNFKEILKYKNDNFDNTILLIGNHDYHYFPNINERYSGYQSSAFEIQKLITDNLELFQIAYEYDYYLFTHAGVSKIWCENVGINPKSDTIAFDLNELFKYKPLSFTFRGVDPHGDSQLAGPLWIRPRSLKLYGIDDYIQVVGHTKRDNIELDKDYIFIDTLINSNQCLLLIEDSKFNIRQHISFLY